MGFLVPNAVELEVLNRVLTDAMTIRLYGNNKTPAGGDTAAGYTEIVGGGYSNRPLIFANWNVVTTGDFPQASYNQTQIWTFTGPINAPGTIYGYYVTRDSDGKLMLAERFSSALVPFAPETGSQVRVLPRYSVISQF
jgi:hypothetical protein